MRSIEARFQRTVVEALEEFEKKGMCPAEHICFAGAIKGQGYTRRTLRANYKKLVPQEQYDINDLVDIVENLVELSQKSAEENTSEDFFARDDEEERIDDSSID